LAAVTVEELVQRLETVGFVCFVDKFDNDKESRLIVRKPNSIPGNHIVGNVIQYDREVNGRVSTIQLDGVAPIIWFRPDHIHYFVTATTPRSRGAYEKWFANPAEVYDEVIHYFFDADSPMHVELGFVSGPGRPENA
jgi:hypothetical protein